MSVEERELFPFFFFSPLLLSKQTQKTKQTAKAKYCQSAAGGGGGRGGQKLRKPVKRYSEL